LIKNVVKETGEGAEKPKSHWDILDLVTKVGGRAAVADHFNQRVSRTALTLVRQDYSFPFLAQTNIEFFCSMFSYTKDIFDQKKSYTKI